jgi:hypothetical protein
VRVDLFLVIVDFGVRLSRRRLAFADLNRRWLLRRTRWRRSTSRRASIGSIIGAIALICRLAPGLNVCQRRPDKFAIHGTSSKKIYKKNC